MLIFNLHDNDVLSRTEQLRKSAIADLAKNAANFRICGLSQKELRTCNCNCNL